MQKAQGYLFISFVAYSFTWVALNNDILLDKIYILIGLQVLANVFSILATGIGIKNKIKGLVIIGRLFSTVIFLTIVFWMGIIIALYNANLNIAH